MQSGKRWLGVILLAGWLGALTGCGGTGSGAPAAWVKEPKGKVQARREASATFADSKDQDPLLKGGAIRTGEDGQTKVRFADSSEAALAPEGYLEIVAESHLVNHKQGRAIYEFGKQESPARIETPHGVTAVLGTTLMIQAASDSTTVAVEKGKVSFTPRVGTEQIIEAGYKITATTGTPVAAPIAMDPAEREKLFSLGGTTAPLINPK
jgi:ferric-dicitrate binding protein FerR (iron transport regulator)